MPSATITTPQLTHYVGVVSSAIEGIGATDVPSSSPNGSVPGVRPAFRVDASPTITSAGLG